MSNRCRGRLLPAIVAALSLSSAALAQPECTLPQPFPPCGSDSVTVKKRATMTLPAGTFGDVRVRNGGTLILQAGDYVLCSLHVSRRGSLLFESAATISVSGDVRFSNSTFVGPVPDATISPCDVELLVNGASVAVQRNAAVRLTLCAPNASLHVNKGADLVGTFFAHKKRFHRVAVQGCPAPPATTTSTTTTPTTSTSTTTEPSTTTTTTTPTPTTLPACPILGGNCGSSCGGRGFCYFHCDSSSDVCLYGDSCTASTCTSDSGCPSGQVCATVNSCTPGAGNTVCCSPCP
jgi:hypothetical protein